MKYLAPLFCVASASIALAGCGGGQTFAGAPQNAGTTQLQSSSKTNGPFDNGGRCQNEDGVKVAPCRVVFDSTHPGPVIVRVDSSHHAVMERDNCTTAGIATIAPAGNFTFTVTAGATAGACTAHFVRTGRDGNGRQVGAVLTIVNRM